MVLARRLTFYSLTHTCVACVVFVSLFIASQSVIGQQRDVRQQAAESWQVTMAPIIQNACLDCHAGEGAEGSLDLEAFETLEQVVDQRRLWSRIATRVRDRQMPPEDGPELSDDDRRKFLDWVDNVLPEVACNHPHHAGPVTIRRLTRYEYANTVRELLKVNYPFTDAFPVDEVGYGFDNIGDVLSVSPLLLEKYLVAAEKISELAIYDPAKHNLSKLCLPSEFGAVPGGRLHGAFMVLTTQGTITQEVVAGVDGRYRIEILSFANQAGDELANMALSINGKLVDEVKVRPHKSSKAETFEFSARLTRGTNKVEVTFTNDYYDPKHPNRHRRDRNLAVGQMRIHGPESHPKPSPAQKALLFVSPDAKKDPRTCAEEIINLHAARAFRRRLYSTERQQLLKLFDLGIENGESFEGAMQLVVQAMLVSPHFLFKVEAPAPEDGSIRHLSDYELATAVSYFLWGSMPDDQLFRVATREALTDPATLKSEVRRMLQDPRSVALIDNFASQWLQLRVLQQIETDPERYPGFTDHLRDSMATETRLLLVDVIQKDEPLTTLLTANYTYVNKALARHYGWPTRGLAEREFSRVSLEETNRRGLLSHASFLTMTSNPTRTSPVKRGKWVLENLLADPPPPALPDVPQLDSQEELKGTLRERMEQHRADPNCAACHYKMDALGFALENFDVWGRYRMVDDGEPIDSTGELPNGTKFSSAVELQDLIVRDQQHQFIRCIVEKLFIYALGRGPRAADDCLIDAIAKEAYEQKHRFSDIVLAIVSSEAFRARSQPTGRPSQGNGSHE